jgi:hypothetical protein
LTFLLLGLFIIFTSHPASKLFRQAWAAVRLCQQQRGATPDADFKSNFFDPVR